MAKVIEELKDKISKKEESMEAKTTPDGNKVETSADEKEQKKANIKAKVKKIGGYFLAGAAGAAAMVGAIVLNGKKTESDEQPSEPDQAEDTDN